MGQDSSKSYSTLSLEEVPQSSIFPEAETRNRLRSMVSFSEVHSADMYDIELKEMLKRACRIIISHITQGEHYQITENAQRFREEQYIKAKWGLQVLSAPYELLPGFVYDFAITYIEDHIPTVKQVYEFLEPLFGFTDL